MKNQRIIHTFSYIHLKMKYFSFCLVFCVLNIFFSWKWFIFRFNVFLQVCLLTFVHCCSSSLKIVNRRPPPTYNKLPLVNVAQPSASDTCSLYKVSMNQELVYQYMEYEANLPDLKEFTLCMWKKFHNHSDDHPLFSYSRKCF